MRTGPFIALGLGVASLAPAGAQACVRFQFLDSVAQQAYDPFSPATFTSSILVRMDRTDSGEANRVVFMLVDTFAQGADPGIGIDGPARYDIVWPDDPARIVLTTGNTPLGPFSGASVALGSQGAPLTTLRIIVPHGQNTSAGRHSEDFAIRYRCYTDETPLGGEQEQPSSPTTQFAMTVPRQITARLAGEQTEGRIDFGIIDEDDSLQRSVSISARATAPYALTLASDNHGKLAGQGGIGAIRYRLTFDGVELAPGEEMRCPMTGAPSGISAPLGIELSREDVRTQPAGRYHDSITLTFAPVDGYVDSGCTRR